LTPLSHQSFPFIIVVNENEAVAGDIVRGTVRRYTAVYQPWLPHYLELIQTVHFALIYRRRHIPNMEPLAAPESWQYCDICRTEGTKPFSAKRVLERHMREQHSGTTEHLCQDCDKPFKQARYLKRHRTTPGQCPGRKIFSGTTSGSSKKHALSVSPNGIAWKIQKSSASDPDLGRELSFTSAARCRDSVATNSAAENEHRVIVQGSGSVDDFRWSQDNNTLPESRSNSSASSGRAKLEVVFSPSSKSSSGSNVTTSYHDDTHQVPVTPPTVFMHTASMEAFSEKRTLEPDLIHHHKEDRIERAAYTNDDSSGLGEKQPSSFSHADSALVKSTAPLDEPNQTSDWLSSAMESASLKDDNLSYPQVKGLLSSTTATGMSSLGSLFLKRSPRNPVLGWSLSPLPKASTLACSSVRSAEMPAPMLTGPVDGELHMSRSANPQSTSKWIPIPVTRCRDGNEEMMHDMSRNIPPSFWYFGRFGYNGEFDVNYRSKSRNSSTALMICCMKGRIDWVCDLIKKALRRQQRPLLSLRDDQGSTILDLAAHAGCSHQLTTVLRFFVAVACCECTETRRTNSVCGFMASKGLLEGDELEATDHGCPWGMKLRCLEWPTNDALESIDEYTAMRTHRDRMQ